MEPILFAKPQLCQEHPLQENSPSCLGSIINLHSEPDSDFLEIWSPDHTALIHAADVERDMVAKYLQPPNGDQLWTKYSNCLLPLCCLWTGKVWDLLHWNHALKGV